MNIRIASFHAAVGACLMLAGQIAVASEPSVADLVASLKSSEIAVKLQAIDELGALRAKAADAVAPLTELLKDNDAKVRAHAVHSLGEIGEAAKSAMPAIIDLVKDPDELVRRQVVRAVLAIRPGPQVTVPLCVKLLEDSDPGVRLRVLNAIAAAGSDAVPGLIEALKNEKATYWACVILRDLGPVAKDAVPALIETLQTNSNPAVRREVLLTLAAMGETASSATSQIAKAIGDEQTRVAATYALGRIGRIPAGTEEIIRTNAASDDKLLSITSLWALARVHPEDQNLRREVMEQLINRLKDEDELVRTAASRSLASLPPAPEITVPIWEKALQNADEQTVLYALDAVAEIGAPAVPRLTDALKHEKLRAKIAHVLGKIGPASASATPALTKLITDKDDRVAHEAILALAGIGPGAKAAVPDLLQALQQPGNENAVAIIYALGKIGPDAASAIATLDKGLSSSDPHFALASAWALTQIEPASADLAKKALPILVAGLSSEHPIARHGAAVGLAQLGPFAKEAVPSLKKVAVEDSDPAVQKAAAEAIERINGN